MKILYISAYFHPVTGGAENHMYYIAKELVKRGHEIEVYVSDRDRENKISKRESVVDGIKIKRFKTWFKISLSGMFFPSLFPAVRKSDADIIHIHGYRHPFSYSVYFNKKPCFITPHWPNYPKGIRRSYLDLFISLYDLFLGKALLRKFTNICVVNELEIPWIKKFSIPDHKIKLTPNGIPRSYLKKANPLMFRKKFKIKKNELLILCLSRLHKSKGLDQVIRVAKHFPKAKFVFVGVDGGFKKELKNLSKELNLRNIIFTGKVSEKEKLQALRSADIFVHPSHFEAFGIVVLEAFSQETAVLTSNSGGLPWVVGDCGLIFEDNNEKDLKEKLDCLIKNKELREKLAKRGRKKVEEFTWEKITDRIEEMYKKAIKNS